MTPELVPSRSPWAPSDGHPVQRSAPIPSSDHHPPLSLPLPRSRDITEDLPSPPSPPSIRLESANKLPPSPVLDAAQETVPSKRSVQPSAADSRSFSLLCHTPPATPSGKKASFEAESSPPTALTSEDPPDGTIQPPVQLLIAPDTFAALLRTAVLECQSHNETEIPKTFADFTRWLQQQNEARSNGALLRTPP